MCPLGIIKASHAWFDFSSLHAITNIKTHIDHCQLWSSPPPGNATVTNQPAAVRCPGQYCRCLHIGTASGNYCREFLASDGHRKMSARTSRDVPADVYQNIAMRSGGARPASGGLPSGNRPIPLRESHDGTHIVRSSGDHRPDIRRITVRCPACKSLHPTLSLCECFIKRFQMNISCKISD